MDIDTAVNGLSSQNDRDYQILLEAIPDLIMRLDREGICLDFRLPRSFAAWGAEIDWKGKFLWEFAPLEIAQQKMRAIAQAFATNEIQVYEQQIEVGGRIQYEEVRVICCHSQEVLIIVRDISDRKRAEFAIVESESRFRSFVENANDLIYALSPIGVFTYVSPKLTEMTGLLPSEVIGKSFAKYVHPDDLHIAQASVQRTLETGERQTEIEFRSQRKDGSWCWVLCNSSAITGSNGAVISILGIARDVSDRKADEEALRRSEAQLRQQAIDLENTLQELRRTQAQLIHSEKMSSLGQLVAGIAHEINNPISFIYGNVNHARTYLDDLIRLFGLYRKHHPQPSPEIERFIDEIDLDFMLDDLQDLFQSMQTGAERIRGIVLSLRNFSRLDEAELKFVDIHDGIESTLALLQNRLCQEQTIQISKHYAEIPQIECFAGSLNQVFLQILTNAIDALETAMQSGQRSPTIEIHTAQVDADWIRIEMIDNGLGISEAVQARMFDPFFTTKPVGKGTGMGLSTSYQIVTRQHSGKLKCGSALMKGARFAIDLPIRQTPKAESLSNPQH